jgi:hypothetical protein
MGTTEDTEDTEERPSWTQHLWALVVPVALTVIAYVIGMLLIYGPTAIAKAIYRLMTRSAGRRRYARHR